MRNKLLGLLMVILVVMLFIPCLCYAMDLKYENYLHYEVNEDSTVAITGCDTTVLDILIPDEIDGNPVTTIKNNAFVNCQALKSVYISSNVSSIENGVFANCFSLNKISVVLNNTYFSVEDNVLFNKDKSKILYYPIGKTEKSYTIPETVKHIGSSAFTGCKLENIFIPDSVTSIGVYAFSDCRFIKTLTIPNSVTLIESSAFQNCRSLSSIQLSNNINTISSYMFQDCTSLSDIIIPNNVTSISKYAFDNCENLKYINIPESISSIGDYAFYDCSALTYINLSSNIVSIGSFAFSYCASMTSINIEKDNKNYLSIDGVLFDKSVTKLICYPDGKNESAYTIPNGVVYIDNGAFGSSSIESITIPRSVLHINYAAFYGCQFLSDIYYQGTESDWNKIEEFFCNATVHFFAEPCFNIIQNLNRAEITNISEYTQNAMIIIAKYNNAKLKNIEFSFCTFAPDEKKTYNIDNNEKYRVFVWDSLQGMRPLNK